MRIYTAENRRGSLVAPLDSLNRKHPSARYTYAIIPIARSLGKKLIFFYHNIHLYIYYMEKHDFKSIMILRL